MDNNLYSNEILLRMVSHMLGLLSVTGLLHLKSTPPVEDLTATPL